jgi:hypothetical protein
MGTAFGWTVSATRLAVLLAVIALLAMLTLRLGSRIDRLGRDLRSETREGFAQLGNRLRLLGRDRP